MTALLTDYRIALHKYGLLAHGITHYEGFPKGPLPSTAQLELAVENEVDVVHCAEVLSVYWLPLWHFE